MPSLIYTAALNGLSGIIVEAEASVSRGFPCFEIVGLPDNAVKEAKQRVRIALKLCGCDISNFRVVVNLAPADIKKEGSSFDVAIFAAILADMGKFDCKAFADTVFCGELALSGRLRSVRGLLNIAICAGEHGFKKLFCPPENVSEACLAENIAVYSPEGADQLLSWLAAPERAALSVRENTFEPMPESYGDFSEVKGQRLAKRALEIAAAGCHNTALYGPPGGGKSMLAKRFSSILPPLSKKEALEISRIYSLTGDLPAGGLVTVRPFRAPHHTISYAGLTGGGHSVMPGEITMAHRGVLFLDELPEFDSSCLEALRQPLENHEITIVRAGRRAAYPCDFSLIAAMNPCKCGYYGFGECTCSPAAAAKYLAKISGPLLDRFDLFVRLNPVTPRQLASEGREETSEEIRKRVATAINRQERRLGQGGRNSRMTPAQQKETCRLESSEREFLEAAYAKLPFSARAYDKIVRTAKTIADLAGEDDIRVIHLSEALSFQKRF